MDLPLLIDKQKLTRLNDVAMESQTKEGCKSNAENELQRS